MDEPIKLGILGLGTVGAGVLTQLQTRASALTSAAGRALAIYQVAVRDTQRKRQCSMEGVSLTADPLAVASDPQVDIVVELMGGVDQAKAAIEAALRAGKPVVTANKALIAEHGPALMALAAKQQVPLVYEAAVCGGIPVLKILNQGLRANRIDSLMGIVNGTTHYILSEMHRTGCSYAEALAQAQGKGYVEADPSLDLEGIDAAHKLLILSRVAFGAQWSLNEIHTEGIGKVEQADFSLAQALGHTIKPVAFAQRDGAGIQCGVCPAVIPLEHPLARLEGVSNALLIRSYPLGESFYVGPGAGAQATASAVLADILDIVRQCTDTPQPNTAPPDLLEPAQKQSQYYIRLQVPDEPGCLAAISQLFTESGFSIETMLQTPHETPTGDVFMALMTHKAPENRLDALLSALQKRSKTINCLRRIA